MSEQITEKLLSFPIVSNDIPFEKFLAEVFMDGKVTDNLYVFGSYFFF